MEQLRLLTFGGLNVLVAGHATTGSATQRRRLALLALLAVARDRGLNRDTGAAPG
jgi:DNA-binding SARP family transcriptional activator